MRPVLSLIALMTVSTLFYDCQKPIPLGKVGRLYGTATVDGAPAALGTAINEGSLVVANDHSQVDLVLEGGHLLRLKEGALRVLRQGSNYALSLPHGSLFAAVNKLQSGSGFEVNTPAAIVGVRGTLFLVEHKTNVAYLCVCEGIVEAATPSHPMARSQVCKGQDLWLKQGLAAGAPVDSPAMVQMTRDAFLDMGVRMAK